MSFLAHDPHRSRSLPCHMYSVSFCRTCSTAGLGEFRIRDLNDEINKLMREKGHWEDRIKTLGGPDYKVR